MLKCLFWTGERGQVIVKVSVVEDAKERVIMLGGKRSMINGGRSGKL